MRLPSSALVNMRTAPARRTQYAQASMRHRSRMPVRGRDEPKASVFEVVGAWLHIWTPPRDVVIPPVPRRAVDIGLGVVVVLLGLLAFVALPALDGARDRDAAREQRADDARHAAERVQITREQRAQTGAAPTLRAVSGAPAASRIAARTALLDRVQLVIARDAKARVRTGELEGRVGKVSCDPVAGAPALNDLEALRGAFDCFVPTTEITSTSQSPSGSIGYPFRAVLDWSAFTFAFCRVHQIAGERELPDPRRVVHLPAACRLEGG